MNTFRVSATGGSTTFTLLVVLSTCSRFRRYIQEHPLERPMLSRVAERHHGRRQHRCGYWFASLKACCRSTPVSRQLYQCFQRGLALGGLGSMS